jgi:hypothetical protein
MWSFPYSQGTGARRWREVTAACPWEIRKIIADLWRLYKKTAAAEGFIELHQGDELVPLGRG